MKIMFLNLYYGEFKEKLIEFIDEHKINTDAFCFQESTDELQTILKQRLNDYLNVPFHKFINADDDYFQSTYIRNNFIISGVNNLFETENTLGLETDLEIYSGHNKLRLGNIQGFARPGNKLDSADRISQSKQVLERFSRFCEAKIIGGDFNLAPETESIKMFERAGYRSLISEYKIRTTRNRITWEKYPKTKQYFADYVFVSREVEVKSFEVIDNEVSDHLPMVLEIED